MTFPDKSQRRLSGRLLLFWILGIAGAVAVVFASFPPRPDQTVSVPSPGAIIRSNESSIHIYDEAPPALLFSKNSGDLWFRDENGRERCLASNVVRANFSPDGKKFAYSTSDDDLFIQGTNGTQIVQLARARHYTWSSNSTAVTFLAIAAAEYPELEQIVVYDLNSNHTRYLPLGD